MDVLTGISLVLAIIFAILYYANGKKAEMAMDVARELRKRLDEAEKKTVSDKPCTERANPSPTVSESQEVENLKARLSEAEAELQLKESASKDTNTEISDLRRALAEKDRKLADIGKDYKALETRFSLKESELVSLMETKEHLQRQDTAKSAEIQKLKEELEASNRAIESMKRDSETGVVEVTVDRSQELEERDKHIATLEDSNSVLQSDLGLLMREKEDLASRLTEAEAELQLKESASKDTNTEISDLRRALAEKTEAVKREQKKAESQSDLIKALQEQVAWMSATADKEREADKILSSAKKEAESIIKEAKDKAETTLNYAKADADVILYKARTFYTSEKESLEQAVKWKEEKLKKIEQQSEALIAQAYGTRKVIMEGVDVDEFLLANGMYNNLRANILSDDTLADLGGEISNLRKKLKANLAAQKKFKKKNGGSAAYMKGSLETSFFYTGATTFGTMTFDVMSENIISAVPTEGLEKSLEKVNNLKNICEYHMHSNGNKGLFYADYIRLKLEELKLVNDIHVLREAKKEEQRRERQRLADEMKAQKDFEREIKRAQKDEEEARKALERAELEAAKEKENKERLAKLQEQIERLKTALKEAEERGQRILSMAQQTRRGWVYIISNIGSFGEGVYKIGLTRRLDPMERVYELGDASVPFPFDVHAFIFSEDAPALETALHQAFDKHKVNSVNWRKEYFKVSLDAIKRKVAELGYEVDWEDYAYAPQFRDSVLRK